MSTTVVAVQFASVLATIAVAIITGVLNSRATARSKQAETNIQNRTLGIEELEKALSFTGLQLTDLRSRTSEQEARIRELQLAHEDCVRDNRRLDREIRDLRMGLEGHL